MLIMVVAFVVSYLLFGLFMVAGLRMVSGLIDDEEFDRESLILELTILIIGPLVSIILIVIHPFKSLYNKLRGN